jgi:hypothetical protein
MKFLNISFGGGGITQEVLKSTLLFKLLEKLSINPIRFTNLSKADLIFYGPYYNLYEKLINKFFNKFSLKNNFNPNILKFYKTFNRGAKKIFLSFENSIKYRNIKADYYFTNLLGIPDKNHFRIPYWKNCANWPEYDIIFEENVSGSGFRYGSYYSIEKMMRPQGDFFIKKNKKFCFFTSHMIYPRNEIYSIFKENFTVDGYGSYFDKKIDNHNSGLIKKKEILEIYSFNLCPHTFATPGMYGSDVSDAFLARCLPVTWAEQNINHEFNKKSFVNLIEYQHENYSEIIDLLKDDIYLKRYTNEPLLESKPTLDKEITFVKSIINSL